MGNLTGNLIGIISNPQLTAFNANAICNLNSSNGNILIQDSYSPSTHYLSIPSVTTDLSLNITTGPSSYIGNLYVSGTLNVTNSNVTINGGNTTFPSNGVSYNFVVPISGNNITTTSGGTKTAGYTTTAGNINTNFTSAISIQAVNNPDLSYNNVFTFSIQKSNTSINALTPILTISPKAINGHNTTGTNKRTPWIVTSPTTAIPETNIYDYITKLQNIITNYSDLDGSYPLTGSLLAILSETQDDANIQLTINIDKNINNLFGVTFWDPSMNDPPYSIANSTWYNYLKINDIYYNLNGIPNYSVRSSSYLAGNTVDIINDTYFTLMPEPKVAGLYDANDPTYNSYVIDISGGTYTRGELFNTINNQFTSNPILNGSQIYTVLGGNNPATYYTTTNGNGYITFRFNINRAYTSLDYNVVFYDIYSFVKCYVGSTSVRNISWDDTLGWILGFRNQTVYSVATDTSANNVSRNGRYITGDTTYTKNTYNYFLIQLDDYTQSHLNDGLVTVTNSDNTIPLPSYSSQMNLGCNPATGQTEFLGTTNVGQNKLTQNQIYAAQQILLQQQNQQTSVINTTKGPYAQDIFGFIPIKTSGLSVGDTYIDYSGPLQNQQRLYFGPVNIRRMTIQLLNDKGDIVDLNGSNWSFSFVCEQLYQQRTI